MSTDERPKRPKLDRTGPIRGWAGLFGAARPATGGERAGSMEDVVSRSVELGYRVVDEYVRQGQRAAASMRDRSLDPATATSDLQEMLARMAQYTSDFAAVWVEFLELASRGALPGVQPPADATRTGAGVPPSGPATARGTADAGVRVEIVASRPTAVSVDLRGHAAGTKLVVQGLRAIDPEAPRLAAVATDGDGPDGPLTVRIHVPDDQPAGVYNGLVIEEETSRPVGTVSVRVGPP